MNLENCITVNTKINELSLQVYIGYDIEKDLLYKKEVITADDGQYDIIKRFFFNKLNEYVSEQVKKIEACVQ